MQYTDFVTILSFGTYLDAAPAKSLLESAGIPCFLKDEHTVTTDPLLTQAVGGIKLQVPKDDYYAAKQILEDSGYNFPVERDELPAFWQWMDERTRRLPLIGSRAVGVRFLVLLLLVLSVVVAGVVYANRPTVEEMMTQNDWCVDYMEHNGVELHPHTMGVVTNNYPGSCVDREITFTGYMDVVLPGFRSLPIRGRWRYDEEKERLIIADADSLAEVYTGEYEVEMRSPQMILRSASTVIYCTRELRITTLTY